MRRLLGFYELANRLIEFLISRRRHHLIAWNWSCERVQLLLFVLRGHYAARLLLVPLAAILCPVMRGFRLSLEVFL